MRSVNWIDLKDGTGVRLRYGTLIDASGVSSGYLFIERLSSASPKWAAAVRDLNFIPSRTNKFLSRKLQPGEMLRARDFHSIWPRATKALLPESEVRVDFSRGRTSGATPAQTQESRELATELANALRLGRNADGHEVFERGMGRVIYRGEKGLIEEASLSMAVKPHLFLRAPDAESLDHCADGMVEAMLRGEVQRSEDLDRFIQATTGRSGEAITAADREVAHEVIDAAIVRRLTEGNQTANDAYGDSVRLYELAPAYRGQLRGKAAMPAPLAIIAQRLLGDTTGKQIVLPNAFDGAGFSFLPTGTRIRAFKGARDLSARAALLQREGLEWHDNYSAARETGADGVFYNADPVYRDGRRQDYMEALAAVRSLQPGGRAVLVLAGDDPLRPGHVAAESDGFYRALETGFDVEDAFEVARELTSTVGTGSTLRVVSLRRSQPRPDAPSISRGMSVVHSWDEVKARVDESLARAQVREADSAAQADLARLEEESRLQRPYIAFSKVAEATLMVPRELQAPMAAFMSELEAQVGPVDDYVRGELRLAGDASLASMFGAEQMDSLAATFFRLNRGRGIINGGATGTGKGRYGAGVATWALKQNRPVVFITDRANLFSDLARDLRDIGEWGRVRPLIMNSDGKVEDNIGGAGLLAAAMPPAEMSRILANNVPLGETGCNVIMTTYSQIAQVGSEKAQWLKNQLRDAVLVVDEAHVAAGSSSNISMQVAEMAALAWGVVFASATWAKSQGNLHIFARALPESVSVATLAQTMKRGGEAFSEVFSSMLARDGALLVHEHDASKVEFDFEIDADNEARNNAVADQVAAIMASLAYMAGEVKRVVTRVSDVNISTLREARRVRASVPVKIFQSRFGTGSVLYQVFRRINGALNADNAVSWSLRQLEAGRKPVLVFDDTGEAFVRQAIEEQTAIVDGVAVLPSEIRMPTIRDLMMRMIKSVEEIRERVVTEDDLDDLELDDDFDADGADAGAADPEAAAEAAAERQQEGDDAVDVDQVAAAMNADNGGDAAAAQTAGAQAQGATTDRRKKRRVEFRLTKFVDIAGLTRDDKVAYQAAVDELHRLVGQLPEIPLVVPDVLHERLTSAGFRVGEISGRSFQLRPSDTKPGMYRVVPRAKSKALVNATVRAFNAGDMDVVSINRSGATGLSLHASPRFGDQRQRAMGVIQAPENPAEVSQLIGRVNRQDQVSYPKISMLSTGIYGEVRALMMQNKKQAAMSANVRSDRRSTINVNAVPDLLNPVGEAVCKAYLQDNQAVLQRLDIPAMVLDDNSAYHRDLASLLTSRIPMLSVKEQKQVYDQLYTMFEDAIMLAELDGQNPLKPNELDVRAEFGAPSPLFGFDHQGLGSAFDGAVMARRVTWMEKVKVLSMDRILEAIADGRRRLVQSGRAVQQSEIDGCPEIHLDELGARMGAMFRARAAASIAGTNFESVAKALAAEGSNPVKDDIARASFMEQRLSLLVPGRMISHTKPGRGGETSMSGVVLSVEIPERGRESQLALWRVTFLRDPDLPPVTVSLSSLLAKAIWRPAIQGRPEALFLPRMRMGGDFMAVHRTPAGQQREAMAGAWLYKSFVRGSAGGDYERAKEAITLGGNMYLASEWAASTRAGVGAVMSDARGLRHRVVLIKDSIKPTYLRWFPRRLAMAAAVQEFVHAVMTRPEFQPAGATDPGRRVFGDFKSAFSYGANSNSGAIVLKPGASISVYVGKGSRSRVIAALRGAQKVIKEDGGIGNVRSADDPDHVVIASAGRRIRNADENLNSNNWVVMQTETPSKVLRAVQMLVRGPGLEVYVQRDTAIGAASLYELAKGIEFTHFARRLRESTQADPERARQAEELLVRLAGEMAAADQDAELERQAAEFSEAVEAMSFGDDRQREIDFDTGEVIEAVAEDGAEEGEQVGEAERPRAA